MEGLLASVFRPYLPDQLITHITSQELADTPVEYQLPVISRETSERRPAQEFRTKPTDVRIPARLASPLIPYPDILQSSLRSNDVAACTDLHGHHMSQLSTLQKVFSDLQTASKIPAGDLRFDIDSLKTFARQSYSNREKMIAMSASSFARRATAHDLSIAADTEIPFIAASSKPSSYTPFIIMIQRLRTHIAKEKAFPRFDVDTIAPANHEAAYTMFDNGTYYYRSQSEGHHFHLLACGGHFRFYHAALGYWFCGPTAYLDYVFSIADILNNLDALKDCEEYSWAIPVFKLMVEFAECEGFHKQQVDFMKGLEGFFLTMSDYDESFAMNWKPILETTQDLWSLDKVISRCDYDYALVLSLMAGHPLYFPKESYLCRFIVLAKKLSRTQCQEVSALHKLIFYAEVNARAGVEKFLKRVHTPRKIDKQAVKNLTRLAKQLLTIAYRRRHKSLPNVIGPVSKVKLLEVYARRGDDSKIEGLPLNWWDEMKIFDCMDNTLTSDPLEFAKDKGALRKDISFGPGDSKKELLQVIERQSYKLKDFFKGRNLNPLPKRVIQTRQKQVSEPMEDPARLIEKEREQKYEARLFANAELENKHSLSLAAAKMKKALSYFDEQLMTPTDKKRKAIIHDAARDLAHKDNYSLLLDIEGHNQSMQHENTSELAEFIGHLFGEEGWGGLPHYFSRLNVFHYDEYLDEAIHSTGQLGGIEGWLNPLWTLHTTLMMKLLRVMTDVIVKKIMVYSDDVNAIVGIPQASEPMVQSIFLKIMGHCSKFGMTVKYSQTTLSKHRITMLRQHYADGIRADSTLKRLLSISAGNNPVLVADELEVAGICSSASSALELSNHSEACCYLKNYKLGLLLVRLPHMVLKKPESDSMISHEELPKKLSTLLYYVKDDARNLQIADSPAFHRAAINDVAAYLGRNPGSLNADLMMTALNGVYGVGVAEERMADSADRLLYLQIYDQFIQDLLFFWTYLPSSIGGLGGSLHINLILSGHSVGFSKSLHYLYMWIVKYSSDPDYFLRYLSTVLSVDMDCIRNIRESRLATSNWPSDSNITSVTSSVQAAIRHLVRKITRNEDVIKLFELSDEADTLATEFVNIFRKNFHSRVVQFYHENTAVHFVDLLLNKVETSSGLLTRVRNLTRLRGSVSSRAVENIRLSAATNRTYFFMLGPQDDIIECLLSRKITMFPDVEFMKVEEVLYDDKIEEVDRNRALLTVRRCAPTHFRDGLKVYDDPKIGNETLYKGELLDNDRMLGNKEELLAAKVVAVSKWFLTKSGVIGELSKDLLTTDVVKACDLCLSTLTTQSFSDLVNFAPTETGGEILHRIPNIRFSTTTYIRSEMNRSLKYTTDLNQSLMTSLGLVDSNVNVDYLRMRYLVAAVLRDKREATSRLVVRYGFSNLKGICDVQFVMPKHTSHKVEKTFGCYGLIRGNLLSEQRFRYLAHSYMYEENMSEWALMPSIKERQTAEQVGVAFVNDIILRYARDLDKDYLLIHPEVIDGDVWAPLIEKLDKIDRNWRGSVRSSAIDEIRNRLVKTLDERGRMTMLDPKDKVVLALQSQCVANLEDCRPQDDSLKLLSKQYGILDRARRRSKRMSIRMAQYQSALAAFESHRSDLAVAMVVEYLLTFHFKVARISTDVYFDVEASIAEFLDAGLGSFSHMMIAPDLQFQLLLLGYEYVTSLVESNLTRIRDLLTDVTSDVSLADIDIPSKLPSLPNYTLLTGEEEIPIDLIDIEYIMTRIGAGAMSSLKDMAPLCTFAHRCSISGASPLVFSSHTGSDSLGAQLGLFRLLRDSDWIDGSTRICDLTAGRGDGLYAAEHLGLDCTSFTRTDTFTRLNHHPRLEFFDGYDVFNGSTLKFVTRFDHIHIDISFTGSIESNILDVIMMLEEHNLQYSIRLNSVHLDGYTKERLSGSPDYEHFISYATHATMKPYQIYLLGRPSDSSRDWDSLEIKDTMAFRAMAVSFASLLSPANAREQMWSYSPNSVSIQLPKGRDMDNLLSRLTESAILEEQRYYLDRFVTEVGESAQICIVKSCCIEQTIGLVNANERLFRGLEGVPYPGITIDSVGNVSQSSRPHHNNHIEALLDPGTEKIAINLLDSSTEVLEHFRSRHPLSEIRTWCNIAIGLRTYCLGEFMSGYGAIEEKSRELRAARSPKLSVHQREVFLALRLLIVAASRDSYEYGIDYCKGLSLIRPSRSKGLHRVLRIYRLSSYLFRQFQTMMARGLIDLRALNSIKNSVEVREKTKYKYSKAPVTEQPAAYDPELANRIIGDQMEKILEGFEKYAQALVEGAKENGSDQSLGQAFGEASMIFDLSIGDHVDAMVEKLGLKPSGPHGIIDLGDEDIIEADDW
uniref:RNA-directed RNA polymerase n=1 Tax=Diaporthe gulyae ophiovirus 1 TaxID=3077431 RepID=A0AA96H9V2_9VIRU|nr:MAG: RNA-dependent RNA polymerase [Diaporthe gulyae ophiovirus 1]